MLSFVGHSYHLFCACEMDLKAPRVACTSVCVGGSAASRTVTVPAAAARCLQCSSFRTEDYAMLVLFAKILMCFSFIFTVKGGINDDYCILKCFNYFLKR